MYSSTFRIETTSSKFSDYFYVMDNSVIKGIPHITRNLLISCINR